MKMALKNESKDVISAPCGHCFAQLTFPIETDRCCCSVRCPQRIGLCERLRWGQRTLQRTIFESGNQEARKMGISKMESKSLRGNRTRTEPSEFSTDFVLFC
jgi:hypothetical protein